MPERPALNEATVKALSIPEKGNRVYYFAGDVLQGLKAPQGFGVRVTAAGIRSFVLNYRLRGREYRYTIGQYPTWSALRAVREARDLRQRIDRGENPLAARLPSAPNEAPKVVADVIEEFLRRYVQAPGRPLRSAKEYERALRKQVVPAIGKLGIHDLRRSQIVEMLDAIEDEHGPVQADRTLAYFRKCLNWYATRDDRFVPPIVPGMARTKSKERARERILSDDEIRLIWRQLSGTFGAFVKVLLLTGQRRSEVGTMRRTEIDKDGVWIIPPEKCKSKRAQVVPLSKVVREIIEAQSNRHDHVFSTRKETGFSAWGNAKKALDQAIAAARSAESARERCKLDPMAPWTLHDLRRTAKTLMVRIGVRPDISERVLGHAISGVEGVYDRHSYLDEKRDALEKLAAMVECILNPAQASVVALDERLQGARP